MNSGTAPTLVADEEAPALASPADAGEVAQGTMLGRYVVLGKLGDGGMGVVYAGYDPELDRKVALKLMRPALMTSETFRVLILREAQALAKLSHPNVVAVHDVGTRGEQVWIAMEFVAGRTLSGWLTERPRRWHEVLRVLVDVARGVAAAHAEGLVHRDLKPDNVMIDGSGRVRVMDFGLAHGRIRTTTGEAAVTDGGTDTPARHEQAFDATIAPEPADALRRQSRARPEVPALGLRLTRAGAVMGTPAYMAPEQWQGQEAEPATDQFGWSVMTWEALYGERPFAGASVMALATAVIGGQRRPPPAARRVPGWLRRAIERGLAVEPARRWPSMQALIATLERGQSRARLRAVVLAGAGLAALAAGVVGARRWDVARRVAACEAVGVEIDAVWNEEVRRTTEQAIVATGAGYAATTAERVVPWLARQAAEWRRVRTDVCIRATVHGEWSADSHDRAAWCLDDRRLELSTLIAELGRADALVVQRAVQAAARLGSVDACADEAGLRDQPAPPAEVRDVAREIRADVWQATMLGLAGRYGDGVALARRAHERAADELGWRPLVVAARSQEAWLLQRQGLYDRAEEESAETFFESSRIGAWGVAAEAATSLIFIVGFHRARHAEGRAWARHAESMIAHAGDIDGLREAGRLNNLGVVEEAAGRYAEARALHERALGLRIASLGEEHPSVGSTHNQLGMVQHEMGDLAAARASFRRTLAITERVVGSDHPSLVGTFHHLSLVEADLGNHAEARALCERALVVAERAYGPDHRDVATVLSNLAARYDHEGGHDQAKELLVRALAIKRKAVGPEHPEVALLLAQLARAHRRMKEPAEARRLYEQALGMLERSLGPDHPDVAAFLDDLGQLHVSLGDWKAARPLHERALAIREKSLGGQHRSVASTLVQLGRGLLADARPGEARPLLARAVAIYDAVEGTHEDEPHARFQLAQALIATGGDRSAALAEATKALAGFRAAGAAEAETLATVEAWLAAHREAAGP